MAVRFDIITIFPGMFSSVVSESIVGRAVPLGIDIARVLHKMYPKNFPLAKVGRLLCHPPTIESLGQGKTLSQIEALWKADLAKFNTRRANYLLYE